MYRPDRTAREGNVKEDNLREQMGTSVQWRDHKLSTLLQPIHYYTSARTQLYTCTTCRGRILAAGACRVKFIVCLRGYEGES